MKVAILSDLHANYPALWAVLEHAREKVDRFWFLGDVVGYGPHPRECLDWLRQNVKPEEWVLGNHDAVLLALALREHWLEFWGDDLAAQNEAKARNRFAFAELDSVKENVISPLRLNLQALLQEPHSATNSFWRDTFDAQAVPLGPKKITFDQVNYWLVHASCLTGRQFGPPYNFPWSSISLGKEIAELQFIFEGTKQPLCQWHGHTHVAYLVALDEPAQPFSESDIQNVLPGKVYPLGKALTLANPGSVGQPRNGDDRACYAVLDTSAHTIVFYRVPYNVMETVNDLTSGGYPSRTYEILLTAPLAKEAGDIGKWAELLKQQKEFSL